MAEVHVQVVAARMRDVADHHHRAHAAARQAAQEAPRSPDIAERVPMPAPAPEGPHRGT